MLTISANTVFKVLAPKFVLQSATASTQLTASVDGVTFTNFGDAFTGVASFDNVTGMFFKCANALMCTEPAEVVVNYTITITATNCTIEGFGPASNSVVTVPAGSAVPLRVMPYNGYKFNGWSDGYTETSRVIVANANISVGAECVVEYLTASNE